MQASGYDVPDLALQYQHTALPEAGHIPILVLRPSEDIGSPVECDMEAVPLSREKSDYVALSYSWGMDADGDTSLNRSITICGKPKAVTQNLFECLRRTRHGVGLLRIWIDAICINQTDDDEKTRQVANIAEVYANAERTIVWLDEHDRNGNDAEMFALLKCLSTADYLKHPRAEHSWREIHGRVHVRCDLVTSSMKDLTRGETNEVVTKMLQFLKRRYFARRWTVQEVRNSSEVTLYWNKY
ncbi:Heterokaryon incompatibility protein 6, OR allele [Fulvia fulva]|uniref:Heterokaryon incompatibility protein 6, OR allele n=1 Tax=Passalora fulva TaxID=5499 RepID=A0A9Q8L4Z2_PASFU|nr:Heterokaryon incompatibility protein 6, OR allele [Fulvia fulva]KAK4634879.1 Heterokaryon incompatibility protein 6, OR allele [Fulvia fulva]KAK4638652.1 Heterokaryon incompatibility protein 6, OR allele [Fulvia fulva]UJO10942.1 Heterokaryon incompatibility protein 6, OR allele [Fulvia fulva]WPV09625.1 Heterokaryon incompatibility protein 6, OR allele [Fulvia fulva]WPV25243.1 Heterokaryon incompatibility protein 6, OR allele [Fulvia fulva]